MLSPPPLPLLNEVVHIRYGVGVDCQFTIKCNGIRFGVLIPVASHEQTLERDFLDRMDTLQQSKDDEGLDLLFEELSDVLAGICQPFFRQFAGYHDDSSPHTLRDIFSPKFIGLRMSTLNGKARVILEDNLKAFPYFWDHSGLARHQFGPEISSFALSQIRVHHVMKPDAVFKVCIEGMTLCAKVVSHQSQLPSLKREISSLLQIRRTDFHTRLNVPSIVGLVTSDEDSCSTLGFLMEYIDIDTSKPHLQALAGSASQQQRQKWDTQISHTVHQLHFHGLVWGDAKAENVLISSDRNPWVTDFGGGFTDGWMTSELANTKEGDIMGLQKIQSLLHKN